MNTNIETYLQQFGYRKSYTHWNKNRWVHDIDGSVIDLSGSFMEFIDQILIKGNTAVECKHENKKLGDNHATRD